MKPPTLQCSLLFLAVCICSTSAMRLPASHAETEVAQSQAGARAATTTRVKRSPWAPHAWLEEDKRNSDISSQNIVPLWDDEDDRLSVLTDSIDTGLDKRAPWAASDRSHIYIRAAPPRRSRNFQPPRGQRSVDKRQAELWEDTAPQDESEENTDTGDELNVKEYYGLGRFRSSESDEANEPSEDVWKRDDRNLSQMLYDIASKRRLGRVRSPSQVHPFHMGLGQHVAGSALDTYSQLLANERRRLDTQGSISSRGGGPVRFIG